MARILILALVVLTSWSSWARDLDQLYSKAAFKIGKQKLHAYVADTDDGREKGLMFIEKLPDNVGMLFVFEQERPLNFWMKNTLIPLAIAYLDASGKIVDIQEMEVASSMMTAEVPVYPSRAPAIMALEMNRGWFKRHGIKVGSRLELVGTTKSSLLMAFLARRSSPPRKAAPRQ